MRGEAFNPDLGSCRITPRTTVAGARCSFRITYTVGDVPVAKGGCVRFERPYYFPNPNFLDIAGDALCELTSSKDNLEWVVEREDFEAEKYKPGVEISSLLRRIKGRSTWFYNIRWGSYLYVTLTRGSLKRGDRLTLKYGLNETSAPTISQEYEFTVGVDPDGSRAAPYSGFWLVPGPCAVRVQPARASSFLAVVPSTGARKRNVRVADRDKHGNLAPSTSRPGVSRKRVADRACRYVLVSGRRRSLSNVSLIESPWEGNQLFWGEIHGHTRRSDGLGTPEEYYRYARDRALLDFAAIADHSCYLSEDDWKEEKEETFKFHQPHEFVTFNGYELNYNTEWQTRHGDKNAYFPSDDPPLVYDSDISLMNHRDFMEVIRELKANRAMMVTHAHAGGLLSFHDESLVRLIEIHSAFHGNFESQETARRYFPQSARPSSRYFPKHMIQEVLARGWRLGVISGSDCHVGHPGGNNGGRAQPGRNKGSLTALYAPELTRESLWDALWNRRCYGTTGKRMIVYFDVDGHPMGEEFCAPGRSCKLPLHMVAVGTGAIERIDIVRNNRNIHTIEDPGLIYEGDVEDSLEFNESFGPLAWYYVRVAQKDGHLAWSSPVWVRATRRRGNTPSPSGSSLLSESCP